jgi:DNA-binding NtrC family response regulator
MVVKPRILVVDDEPVVRESLHAWFTQDGYPVDMAANAHDALGKLRESSWDILLTDVKMPGMDGLELQKKAKHIDSNITVIVMTAYASVDSARQAIKEGAYDYVTKPLDPEKLQQIVNRAAEHRLLVRENLQLKERIEAIGGEADEIIGESPETQRLRELIQNVAPTETSVLLTGESGTGKALAARTIHRASPRGHMPLMTLRCADLPEGEMERELFGHEPGAFAGVQYQRKGKLELAHGGGLFMEEIGQLSPGIQSKLERILEERTITRVGGSDPISVNFRLIAATSLDLSRAVEEGNFRRDLYDRITFCSIALSPLRERPSDIPSLARYFLQKAAGGVGGAVRRVSTDAMQLLMEYSWPGNVRELEAMIERAAAQQEGEEILPQELPLEPAKEVLPPSTLSLGEVERQHIQKVLAQMSGNVSKAAQALQVDELTLNEKIRQYGLRTSQD